MADCVALIVASGRGQRFGAERPKQYQPFAGRPVLRHCLERFRSHPRVGAVRAVIHPAGPRALRRRRARARAARAGRGRPDPAGVGAPRAREPVRDAARARADPRRRPAADRCGADRSRARWARRACRGAAGAAGDRYPEARRRGRRPGHGRAPGPVSRADAAGLRLRPDPGGAPGGRRRRADRRYRGRRGRGPDRSRWSPATRPISRSPTRPTSPAPSACSAARCSRGPGSASTSIGWPRRRPRAARRPAARAAPPDRPFRCRRRPARASPTRCSARSAPATSAAISRRPMRAGRAPISALFLDHARQLIEAAGGRIEHVDVTLICERPRIGPHRARDGRPPRRACWRCRPPGSASRRPRPSGWASSGAAKGIAAQAVATVSLPA